MRDFALRQYRHLWATPRKIDPRQTAGIAQRRDDTAVLSQLPPGPFPRYRAVRRRRTTSPDPRWGEPLCFQSAI